MKTKYKLFLIHENMEEDINDTDDEINCKQCIENDNLDELETLSFREILNRYPELKNIPQIKEYGYSAESLIEKYITDYRNNSAILSDEFEKLMFESVCENDGPAQNSQE